jgi:hypothetical protein
VRKAFFLAFLILVLESCFFLAFLILVLGLNLVVGKVDVDRPKTTETLPCKPQGSASTYKGKQRPFFL